MSTSSASAPRPADPAATASHSSPADIRPALEDLGTAVRQMFGAERRLRGRDHAPGELTHAHIRSLHALGAQGELTAGQLAKSADLNPASVTAMLDQLEQAGIVARRRSETDRRVTNVSLTPHGRELLDAKTAKWTALWSERLASYSDDELATAARVMRDMAAMFDGILAEKDRAGGEE